MNCLTIQRWSTKKESFLDNLMNNHRDAFLYEKEEHELQKNRKVLNLLFRDQSSCYDGRAQCSECVHCLNFVEVSPEFGVLQI